jgi:hypothetical protein
MVLLNVTDQMLGAWEHLGNHMFHIGDAAIWSSHVFLLVRTIGDFAANEIRTTTTPIPQGRTHSARGQPLLNKSTLCLSRKGPKVVPRINTQLQVLPERRILAWGMAQNIQEELTTRRKLHSLTRDPTNTTGIATTVINTPPTPAPIPTPMAVEQATATHSPELRNMAVNMATFGTIPLGLSHRLTVPITNLVMVTGQPALQDMLARFPIIR